MRTFVLGDLHGAHRALVQVLERSGFDREEDRLIFLGDVADGWSQTKECVDELLTVRNLVHLIGNHDEWFKDWVEGKPVVPEWYHQGGRATLNSYGNAREAVPESHRAYLKNAKLWHQEGSRIFVHGGWTWDYPGGEHPMGVPETITWDRDLWNEACRREAGQVTEFDEVYVGHTSTTGRGFHEPVQRCEVWNLDQGAGWEGRLSLMDIDTKEFWQSDLCYLLYPEGKRR